MDDDYKKRAARDRKRKVEKGRFKLPEGETTFRILKTPGDDSRDSPSVYIEYLMHSEVGPDKRFIRCGKSIDGGGKCWLCDKQIPKLESKGKTKLASSLQPKAILEVNVAVLDEDSGELRGPLRYQMTSGSTNKSLAYRVMGVIGSRKKDYLDHKQGYNITIDRTGTGKLDTVYTGPTPDESKSKVPSAIVSRLKPFADTVSKYDEQAVIAAYFGRDIDEDNDDEENDSMARKSKKSRHDEDEEEVTTKKKKKKRGRDDEDEDEEEEEEEEEDDSSDDEEEEEDEDSDEEEESDDDEEEEEEEEDDEPKKKKKKKSKKSDDDEDEEEEEEEEEEEDEDEDDSEEEDEEEEEEEPVKKKKSKKKKRH